jgi:hypothetical protein
MFLVISCLLACAVGLLLLHKRRVGLETISSVATKALIPISDADGLLCRRCGAKTLANVSNGMIAVSSGPLAEAALRRKRQWIAQRGEAFLRKVMYGQRGASLGPLPGERCAQCRDAVKSSLGRSAAKDGGSRRHHKKNDAEGGLSEFTNDGMQGELQCALDMADALLEEREQAARKY